jgi:hypothetical protein
VTALKDNQYVLSSKIVHSPFQPPAVLDTSGEIQILKVSHSCPFFTKYFHRMGQTQDAIKEYGSINEDGNSSVAYGVLFDKTANTRTWPLNWRVSVCASDFSLVEALNGTLRAAKRQKKVYLCPRLLDWQFACSHLLYFTGPVRCRDSDDAQR